MNAQQQSNKKPEVYSISGFKDTLASPVFYPVIVVSLVLGITSIFGFVQNPTKLKTIVNVIQQKVAESNVSHKSLDAPQYTVADFEQQNFRNSTQKSAANAFEDFYESYTHSTDKVAIEGDFERVAFNYDLTSESFWADLDSSTLESAAEAKQRKEREASTFGAPLRIESEDNSPAEFNLKDDSIYALNSD